VKGRKRTKIKKHGREKIIIKEKYAIVACLLLAFFLMSLPTLLIASVDSKDVWGHISYNQTWPYDVAARCDHTGTLNASDDTFTGTGIEGWYDLTTIIDPRYIQANYTFLSGYGGGGEDHDYTTDSPMYSAYQYGPYGSGHYSYEDAEYGNGPYGNIPAYYRTWNKYFSSFTPTYQYSLQGGAQAYFKDPENPEDRWFVSSWIYVMYAQYPGYGWNEWGWP
jgi:hypothetical protein